MFRILWAKAIDHTWTAIVIQRYSECIAGVVALNEFQANYNLTCMEMELRMQFKWWKIVQTPEDFTQDTGWWDNPTMYVDCEKQICLVSRHGSEKEKRLPPSSIM